MEDGQLGVAVIGLGYWGINQVRVFHELPQVNLIAICDQREERMKEVAERFPYVEGYTDFKKMLERDDIDAVVISTNATTHFDIAGPCLKAGKHVLLEKPMTTIVDEAGQLIKLAEENNVTFMVGHTFLFNVAVQKVKNLLTQPDTGDIYYMYSRRTNLGPIRQDVNAVWDLAPHDISVFNYFMDAVPEWVSVVGSQVLKSGLEDVAFIALGYPRDVIAHIHVSWADPNKVRETTVVCSNRRIVFDDLNALEPVRVFDKGVASVAAEEAASFGEYRLQIRDGDILSPRIQISEPLKNLATHFVNCVVTNKKPLSDGVNGFDVVRVLEAIDRSLAKKGAPVTLSPAYSK